MRVEESSHGLWNITEAIEGIKIIKRLEQGRNL